jgi:tRNA A-37 threonylcarbamoyl transferase component Bud32
LLRPLRVLPTKRITGEGLWNGQRVLAKLFVASGSARHWQRELAGVRALAAASIPSPAVLASGTFAGGGRYLLTAFLPDAKSLADTLPSHFDTARPLLEAACERIGQLHTNGLVHDDPHPGNFLISSGMLLLIDGAAVQSRTSPLPKREAQDNLSKFFAQLPPDTPLEPLIAAYRAANPRYAMEPAGLFALIAAHRHFRLDDYLRKTVRPCTLFDVRQNLRRFTAVAREDAAWLAPLLDDPDAAMASGVLLKRGNTATVARVSFAGRSLVIKRYNIKNLAHALSRAWRPSRAWHAWREGHRLCFLGINTPKPRALIEERLGLLRRRAWLIADECSAPNLAEAFAPYADASAPPPLEAASLLHLIQLLYVWRISHGDFKATNILLGADKATVIDLDAMTQHANPAAHTRAWRKDRARLLANWPAESGLSRWLDSYLPKA